MGYEIPPPFQIPVLEEEAELLPEMTALNDKIESTVWLEYLNTNKL